MNPSEMADELDARPEMIGFVPRPGDNVWDMLTTPQRQLLAAALRLAEEAISDNEGFPGWPALAAYRSARERLAGIAP